MRFKPVDEMSLRLLLSTDNAQKVLDIEYLGPVLNSSGNTETSPDAMVLDKRGDTAVKVRCEYKVHVTSSSNFSQNGTFGLAIAWSISKHLAKDREAREELESSLLENHSCSELIILSDFKFFRDLPDYNLKNLNNVEPTTYFDELCSKRSLPSLMALYVAVKIYPRRFDLDKVVSHFTKLFPEPMDIAAQGRANIITAFMQTKPALLHRVYNKCYKWSNVIDRNIALASLELMLQDRLEVAPSSILKCDKFIMKAFNQVELDVT